jgi:hypothetical protein
MPHAIHMYNLPAFNVNAGYHSSGYYVIAEMNYFLGGISKRELVEFSICIRNGVTEKKIGELLETRGKGCWRTLVECIKGWCIKLFTEMNSALSGK